MTERSFITTCTGEPRLGCYPGARKQGRRRDGVGRKLHTRSAKQMVDDMVEEAVQILEGGLPERVQFE